jgi:CRP-like cAMP-binding protein
MKANSYQKKMDIYSEKLKRYFHQNTNLTDEVIDAVVNATQPRKYKKGEIFSKQGEFCNKIAYVCAGMFHGFSTQEDGSLFVAIFLREDDFVKGGFEISEPNTLTIQAICDTFVVEIKKNIIQEMCLQYPELGSVFLCMVEKCFLAHASHMIQIGTNKATDNYLLFQNKFQSDEDCIPQHLIAAYLGITPTQLSRIRKKLAGAQQSYQSITP